MNDRFILGTRRTVVMVNRASELQQIQGAIFRPAADCQVLFITGSGGLGKSRLIDEVLWRGGNPACRAEREPTPDDPPDWDWTVCGKALVADMLDMTDVNLHTHLMFLQAVRDSLVRVESSLDFTDYDTLYQNYEDVKSQHVAYGSVQELAVRVEAAFLAAYQKAAETGRITLCLDTVERLAYSHSSWLIEKGLVSEEELTFTTAQWLVRQIRQGTLRNTTVVLSGRKVEGESFFALIRTAVAGARSQGLSCSLDEIELQPFGLMDTFRFFELQASSWAQDAGQNPDLSLIAETFAHVASDKEQMEVLWLYTGGQPVRLSLYGDLLIEGGQIPERLLDTPEEARSRKDENLEAVQAEIETGFIDLLFGSLGLRSEILKTLVRAPRGLGTDQLHYALRVAPANTTPEPDDPPDLQRRSEIERELEQLKRLSIVKVRPDGRLGLQDEIYAIYANRIAPQSSAPGMEEDLERRIKDEQRARARLYRRLLNWARYQKEKYEAQRIQYQVEDERKLVFQSPANALAVQFRPLTERDQQERIMIREAIRLWEQEELHYALLCGVEKALNDAVFDLGVEKWLANDEEADFLTLEEVYQVLYDDAALRFVEIPVWPSLSLHGRTPIETMRLFMLHTEVIRWMMRFYNRGDSKRFFHFCKEVENKIAEMSEADRRSWNHTLNRGERRIWYDYAQIRWGSIDQALTDLEAILPELEVLARYTDQEMAFPDRNELGFIGHPAFDRLNKVIALGYNYLGYGYVTLGHLRKSIESYSQSLMYMRNTSFRSQHATVLNNLSRALSDRGRGRARRVCLDGLALRKALGAEIPIAYSMNTLALIDNDMLRPDLSWVEAATAVAYFRRGNERRGLGLALIQLGEALRRMAAVERTGRILPDPPELIYDEAERALKEAISIFSAGPEKNEIIRLIEARIEMGCLLRDRLLLKDLLPKDQAQTYANARNVFNLAIRDAVERNYPRQVLDARINLAWTHYYAAEFDAAEKAVAEALESLPADVFFRADALPKPGRDDSYIYQQLGKAYNLRGKIAMDRFRQREQAIKMALSGEDRAARRRAVGVDHEAQKYLRLAAEHYVLGLAYAQLFSPRSSALSALYDSLYEYLKNFNQEELDAFYRYEHQAREQYQTSRIEMEDLGNLDEFLRECFGKFEEQ